MCDCVLLFLHASGEIWSFNLSILVFPPADLSYPSSCFLCTLKKQVVTGLPKTSVFLKNACCGQPLVGVVVNRPSVSYNRVILV